MNKFLIKIVLFLFPIIIGMISLELILKNIPNDYSYKKAYLDKNANEIEVLFMGNSHIFYGINPKYMTRNTFNGAHISQSLNFDHAILKKYATKFEKLKYVIIPVDYFSFYSRLDEGVEKWRVKNYSIYYDISEEEYFWNNFEIFNGKLASHISRANGFLINEKTDISCSKLGFGTNYNSKNNKNLFETGIKAANRHTFDLNKHRSTFIKNRKTINSIINFSKEHHINVIFLTCPAHKNYHKNLNDIQLQNTINSIQQISLKQSNTYYFNFLTDTSFNTKDFYDADHLNEIGAKKLTLKIDAIINKIENNNVFDDLEKRQMIQK